MGDCAGSMMSARMSAVIQADSTLVGTFKTEAKMVFMAQHMITKKRLDARSANGGKGSRRKEARRTPMPIRPMSTESTSRYIVMRLRKESSLVIIGEVH